MFSTSFTSLSVLLFFVYWSPSSSLWTVFDSISSNIDKVLSFNLSANVLVFGDFNVHHKDWLNYSGGTDRTGELCYNLKQPYSNNYLSYVNPRLWFSHSCSFGFIHFFWCYHRHRQKKISPGRSDGNKQFFSLAICDGGQCSKVLPKMSFCIFFIHLLPETNDVTRI